ncbi:MAG: hypothetical protein INR65_11735, partial [Gluconacetobacter diazotrophicus]|nr:hypothetical protein [Gluconacetobacter diazotrophicus]
MTEAELDWLLERNPVLFHMAEAGSWPSIRRHGLLSTAALLDLYGVSGAERERIERRRRPDCVRLEAAGLDGAVVRDQKPLGEAGLSRCLRGGMAPADWYALLNARVFFWLSRRRRDGLRAARPYRHGAHDMLELDARSLVAVHRERIGLAPINTGFTGRAPAPRGSDTFRSIADYPLREQRRRRGPDDAVVELT